MIKHHKIYQDDLDWMELQQYVRNLQKMPDEFAEQRRWQDFVDIGNEISNWFKWFGIMQNEHDTDWAVDPISGERIW